MSPRGSGEVALVTVGPDIIAGNGKNKRGTTNGLGAPGVRRLIRGAAVGAEEAELHGEVAHELHGAARGLAALQRDLGHLVDANPVVAVGRVQYSLSNKVVERMNAI